MNKHKLPVKLLISCLALTLTLMISSYVPVAAQDNSSNLTVPLPQQTTTVTVTPPTAKAPEAKPSLKTPPNSQKPTEVSLGFSLLDLGRIDRANETFDVSGFL